MLHSSSFATCAHSDLALLKGIDALRELGCFNLEFLSQKENIRKVENVFCVAGYVFWRDGPMKLWNVAQRLKDLGGRIPNDVKYLTTFRHIHRKIATLIVQEVFDRKEAHNVPAIACDTTMARILPLMGWADKGTAINVARQVEGWFPRKHWFDLNVVICSLAQLLQQGKHDQLIYREAGEISPDIETLVQRSKIPRGKREAKRRAEEEGAEEERPDV